MKKEYIIFALIILGLIYLMKPSKQAKQEKQSKSIVKEEVVENFEELQQQITQAVQKTEQIKQQLEPNNIAQLPINVKVNYTQQMEKQLMQQKDELKKLEKQLTEELRNNTQREMNKIIQSPYTENNLYNEILNNVFLTEFRNLIKKTQLGIDLTKDKLTIFIPSNNVIKSLDSFNRDYLLNADNMNYKKLLKNHFVKDILFPNTLKDLELIETIEKNKYKVISTDDVIKIGNATVIREPIFTDNGIIYIIDTLLIPDSIQIPLLRPQTEQEKEIKKQEIIDTKRDNEIRQLQTAIRLLTNTIAKRNQSMEDIADLRKEFMEYKIRYNSVMNNVDKVSKDLNTLVKAQNSWNNINQNDKLINMVQILKDTQNELKKIRTHPVFIDPSYAVKV
jgi:uncharacterized surface protein with fasciclin (FAS1) repeats